MKKSFVILLLILLLTGCATAITRGRVAKDYGMDKEKFKYYPATKLDLLCLYSAPQAPGCMKALLFTCLIDTPISFTVDTICLPFDIYFSHKEQNLKESSKDTHVPQQ